MTAMNDDFTITGITRVIFCGKEEYSNKIISFSGNRLHQNELILHLSGKCRVDFNNVILECEENTVRFLPKGENEIYTVEPIENGECIDIFFEADKEISPCAFCMKVKDNKKIAALFKKIFSTWVSRYEGRYFECIALLYQIFAEMQKKTYVCKDRYNKIEPAIQYIGENFLKEKISVPFLAQKCGISETYLKKIFIKRFAMPPSKYIIYMKLSHACDLLSSGRFSVSEVTSFCGYTDVFFFSRQFKKYIGISPSEFKEKYVSSK